MRRIIIIISFLLSPAAANAVDSFDLSTGQLSIPQVIVGNTKYFDLIVTINSLVSGGKLTSPLATINLSPRPDTFDLKRNQLIIPAVTVDNTVYKNLIVTIGEVVFFSGKTEVVAGDPGFNGAWYTEPYSLFVAEDLPLTVKDGITKILDASVELWGNFGPMEYWILGTDSSAALKLQSVYCDRRVAQQHQTEQECLEEQDRRRSYGNNYFESYLRLGLDAIEEDEPRGSTGVNGKRENGFQIIIGSAPWSLMDRTFRNGAWTPSGHDNTPLHEYWHVINFSHISNFSPTSGKPTFDMPASKKGPVWFTEGGAVYMASFGLAELTASGKLPKNIYGNFWNHWQHMRQRMDSGMKSKVQYPNTDLGDYDYDTGRDAAYSLGAWGIAFLLDKINNQNALLDIMFPKLQELGWEEAFQLTFGLSSTEFYLEFEDFLNLPIEEQIKILPTIEGSYINL